MARVRQKAFKYDVFVRVHGALHHVLAEPPGRIDDHDPGETGFGIEREHHPGAGAVGAHHLLNADGQCDLQVIETVVLAVHDCSVGEQRGVAFAAGAQQLGFSVNVQVSFLLPGEARLRQILRGRAAANSHRQRRSPAAPRKLPVGGADGFGNRRGEIRIDDEPANGGTGLCQRLLAVMVRIQVLAQLGRELVGLDVRAIRRRSRRESERHANAGGRERARHFGQPGVFSSYAAHIDRFGLIEPHDGLFGSSRSCYPRCGGWCRGMLSTGCWHLRLRSLRLLGTMHGATQIQDADMYVGETLKAAAAAGSEAHRSKRRWIMHFRVTDL